MSYWKTYCYVDARPQQKPWFRLQVEDVARKLIARDPHKDCFTTIQRFRDPVSLLELERNKELERPLTSEELRVLNLHHKERMVQLMPDGTRKQVGPSSVIPITRQKDREVWKRMMTDPNDLEQPPNPETQVHYCPLYFDFDAAPEMRDGDGVVWLEGIERARADAAKLVGWFKKAFPDIQDCHIQAWFTGSKGFHVTLRPEVFGARPHPYLTDVIKKLAHELADDLELETLDRTVYSRRRMWRIPNTLNEKGRLFKIELTTAELMQLDTKRIVELARKPRVHTDDRRYIAWSHLWERDEYKNIAPVEEAVGWYREHLEQWEAMRDLENLKPTAPILPMAEAGGEYPVCMKDLLDNGPKSGGASRNRTLLPIVGFFKDAGLSKEVTNRKVEEWTTTYFPDPRKLRQRLANGRSVVDQAYRGNLSFACRFTRSVGGKGKSNRVACVGEAACPWIAEPEDQQPESMPFIHLSEASRAAYEGTTVRTAIHVATIASRPFVVPVGGKVHCVPDDEAAICQDCPNNNEGGAGEMEWEITSSDRNILNVANVNDSMKKGAIKAMCGIPKKCFKHSIEVEHYSNLEEIQVIPMVDYAHAYALNSVEEESVSAKSARHVVRLAYYMGHGIEPNSKYIADITVFAHPKDQRVCFVFEKAVPAQNDIDQFEMSPQLLERLKVFQPRKGQSVQDKLEEIHRDLLVNVHRIGGRFDLSVAVDLAYHSVIGFHFANMDVKKGWFELLVVGDTSTGKSTMVERMSQHFGLGELIAGEESKRTGLVYASVQLQGQWVLLWGKIPQQDRRLLVIDEFAGIPPEEVGKLTQLRSEGIARGGGVNQHYTTWARARLILLTNPRSHSESMRNYNYGVLAVAGLFQEKQDLRRVDLALTSTKKDVPSDVVRKRWDEFDYPHDYTADLCRNLILWAWSRDPQHVKWSEEATNEVFRQQKILGETYDCDLPLAVTSDLHLKIARISAAVAARLFSTDERGRDLLVKKEHVQFAATFMDKAYRKDSMGFMQYARKWKRDNHFTEDRKEQIKAHLRTYGPDDSQTIVSMLMDIDGHIRKGAFFDMLSLDQDEFKRLWKFLLRERLIVHRSRGYRKTDSFAELLRNLGVESTGYEKNREQEEKEFLMGGDFDAAAASLTSPFGEEEIETEPPTDNSLGPRLIEIATSAEASVSTPGISPTYSTRDTSDSDSPFADDDDGEDDTPF